MSQQPDNIFNLNKSVVRRYHLSDAADIVKGANSHLVSEYMTAAFPSPYTLEDATAWITIANEEGSLHFAICTIESNIVIGGCGLRHLIGEESRTKVLGYWLAPEYWGRGIMSEVITALSHWVFNQVPTLLKLEASVVEENKGSIKVLERAGYQYEGTRRMAVFKNGHIRNIVLFGLTRYQYIKDIGGEENTAG